MRSTSRTLAQVSGRLKEKRIICTTRLHLIYVTLMCCLCLLRPAACSMSPEKNIFTPWVHRAVYDHDISSGHLVPCTIVFILLQSFQDPLKFPPKSYVQVFYILGFDNKLSFLHCCPHLKSHSDTPHITRQSRSERDLNEGPEWRKRALLVKMKTSRKKLKHKQQQKRPPQD